MNREEKQGMLHFWRYVEEGMGKLEALAESEFTDESIRVMKRIYKKLHRLILKLELALIDRKKEKGKLTPKQARTEKAKVKKRWL